MDLAALESEFQVLERAKLQQLYHPSKTEFCLHFHIPGRGKQYLRIIAGKMINFTDTKRSSLKPSGLCMLLRKYISGAIVQKVWQKDSERILIFDLLVKSAGKERQFHLVVELFSKGNVILCDSAWQIVALQSWQLRRSGAVKMKQEYKFPAARFDWKQCSKEDFVKAVIGSDKKNLATALATDIGLGGLFAEELCLRAKVDAMQEVSSISQGAIEQLYQSLENLRNELMKPQGFVYANELSCVSLSAPKCRKALETHEMFSKALDIVNPLVKQSPYLQKITRTQNIIAKQEEAIAKIEEDIVLNTQKGEKIYEQYADIAQLQEAVREMQKSKDWTEIKKELESLKRVASMDLKKKTIVLDL